LAGTYYAVSVSLLGSCLTPDRTPACVNPEQPETIVIAPSSDTAGTIQVVSRDSQGVLKSSTSSYSISGSTMTLQDVCPAPSSGSSPSTLGYTATSSELDLILARQATQGDGGASCTVTSVLKFVKQ
jgi:hypothetical protein